MWYPSALYIVIDHVHWRVHYCNWLSIGPCVKKWELRKSWKISVYNETIQTFGFSWSYISLNLVKILREVFRLFFFLKGLQWDNTQNWLKPATLWEYLGQLIKSPWNPTGTNFWSLIGLIWTIDDLSLCTYEKMCSNTYHWFYMNFLTTITSF